MKPTSSLNPRLAALRAAAAFACLAAIAGCNVDKEPVGLVTSPDPAQNYPISLQNSRVLIDVYPSGGHVGSADAARIREFVDGYRQFGDGRMIVAAPAGAGYGQAMAEVRKALAAAGLRATIAMGTYPGGPGAQAQPIKLTYRGLKAKVAGTCGRWPSDITSASSSRGWNNLPYENFGCAYQTALAAEVADPRDLDGPRALDSADAQMRMRAIKAVEEGKDPATAWAVKLTAIGSVGN